MNKQYNLKLDLKFKCHNSKMKFDEFDKNTSDFYINLTKDNEVVDIDNAILTLVALKPDGTTESQFLEVKENKVYCNLKESMKDVVGEYSCMAMLTLKDKVIIVEQPIFYTINENKLLRALNREVEGTERFTLLTDMINRLSDIENSEKIRISNESDRLLLQKTLEDLIKEIEEAELDRKKHEVLREKTHQKLKEEIKKSETINANTEATNNVAKELINSVNLTHEEIKKTNKDTKAVLESTREFENESRENEEDRQKLFGNAQITLKELKNSEATRVANENIRIKNEEARELRVSNFETRYNNLIEITETLKSELSELNSQSETNEANRVDAENLRKQRYNEFETAYNSLISDIQSQLENTNIVKADLISKVNKAKEDMTLTVQTALDNLTKKVDAKIVEVNNAKNEMTRQANDTVAKANQSIGQVNAMSNKANETNSKVNEALVKTTKCIDDVNKTKDDLVNQFNALAPSEQSNAEVQLARTDIAGKTHNSLQERLIADNKMQSMLFEEIEGSYITSETVPSNIQEVEIFGNTYQDPNTLEITSVGQEIEGTDAVKIDISSCNKNLIDLKKHTLLKQYNDYIEVTSYSNEFITYKLKPNTIYNLSFEKYDTNDCWIAVNVNGVTINNSNLNFSKSYTTGNDGILIISFRANASSNVGHKFKKIILEENVQSTEYVKHEEDNKEIILPCKLDGFEGRRDRLFYNGTEWIIDKNNNFKIINGSEPWIISKTKENTILFALDDTTNTLFTKDLPQSEINCIGNKVKSYTLNNIWNIDEEGIALGGSVYVLRVAVNKSKLSTLDANGFKKLLKQWYDEGNPLSICYKSEPQIIRTGYTDPNLLNLSTFKDKTHIYFANDTGAEGTIKCKVPKSLGASISSNTKQIEGFKQELDNVKNLVDTVGTMEVTSDTGFVSVDNSIDGYVDDVDIRGKSLVNVAPKYRIDVTSTADWDSFYPLGQSNCPSNIAQAGYIIQDLKPNTKYTIYYTVVSCESAVQFRINNPSNESAFKEIVSVDSSNVGVNRIVLTSKEDFTNVNIALRSQNYLGRGRIVISDIMILEGDVEVNSYIEGIMSVGQDKEMEVLSVKGDGNLFDMKNATVRGGNIIEKTDDYMVVEYSAPFESFINLNTPIFLTKGTYRIKLKKDLINGDSVVFKIFANGIELKVFDTETQFDLSINSKVHLAIIRVGGGVQGKVKISEIQINKGKITLPYQLYKSNKRTLLKPVTVDNVTTYEPIVLRGIDDTIYDSVKGNKLIEICGERDYQEGDETNPYALTDMTRTVYKLDTPIITELPYDLNLRTFANQSNCIVNAGAINPILKFNIKNCLANTVKSLMNKVKVIEESFNKIVIEGFRKVLSGDMQSLAYMVYDMEEVEQEETNKLMDYLPLE